MLRHATGKRISPALSALIFSRCQGGMPEQTWQRDKLPPIPILPTSEVSPQHQKLMNLITNLQNPPKVKFGQEQKPKTRRILARRAVTLQTRPFHSNYELFNCNNDGIRYRSWYYRGCWHQAFPPMVTHSSFKSYSFRLQDSYRDPYRYFLSLLPRVGIE